jgi:hypothetical protein
MSKIKNIEDLRNDLLSNYGKTKTGEVSIALAKELNNGAGKIISTVKAQLEYNKYVGNTSKIPFMCVEPHESEAK